jgi:hypothetical protein
MMPFFERNDQNGVISGRDFVTDDFMDPTKSASLSLEGSAR